MRRRRDWARAEVRKLTGGIADPPRYGDPRWLEWDGDPADAHRVRLAALIVAAESWAREGDNIRDRLARDVAAARSEHEQSLDAEWATVARRARVVALRGIDRQRRVAS
jgi:hypothetical protein